MWSDINNGFVASDKMPKKCEISEAGFQMFLAAHHLLWAYPKNTSMLASTMDMARCRAEGEPIWRWVDRIFALLDYKIQWPEDINDDDAPYWALVVDCVDAKRNELKHPIFNLDTKWCSKKFNKPAMRFELATSVYEPRCIHAKKGERGGKHDWTIFLEELDLKVNPNKRIHGDSGYNGQNGRNKVSVPSSTDSKELAKFKSRARLRHETFNGKIKKFACTSSTFRHSVEKQDMSFRAVVVIIQYQLDNGEQTLFDV